MMRDGFDQAGFSLVEHMATGRETVVHNDRERQRSMLTLAVLCHEHAAD